MKAPRAPDSSDGPRNAPRMTLDGGAHSFRELLSPVAAAIEAELERHRAAFASAGNLQALAEIDRVLELGRALGVGRAHSATEGSDEEGPPRSHFDGQR
jgi:hypothetical protein